ncbi:MAG: uracil-DNA glycosylase [Candidatus Accumulibacter sp.]|jgi:DNA polymerase|nr:uracil-DNA glycosylase [Accumulibacter sp.]
MKPARATLLAEMGLAPVWVRREDPPVARRPDAPPAAAPRPATNPARPAAQPNRPAMPQEIRRAMPPETRPAAPGAAIPLSAPPDVSGLGWPELTRAILECRGCGLCAKRRQAVPGVGDQNADWLFVGEGPGEEEDKRGEPFVGPAGRLLDAMLAAIGLRRGEDVYIANAVKCRPPGNRNPENAEIAACFPYLKRQIALLRPRLIVLLGRAAVNAVLGEERALSGLRGKRLVYRDGETEIPALATYHPAYLLRTLPDKAKTWEDLCRARALMRTLKEGGEA